MKIPPFDLERFFARHEFSAPYLLCASDCESVALGELLDLEPDARPRLEKLWLGYTESLGNPELRREIAGLYETVSPDEILVHVGAEEAIFSFMNVTLSPGDHVIVHWPCYQSLFQVAASIGCEVTRWEASPDDGWELDVSFLRKSLRKNTKAVVLNVPHNPTGYLMSRNKLAQVVRALDGSGVLLFLDEVYRGLEYDAADVLPAGCDVYENAVSLGVMSKSFGLPGLRLGWIATKNRAVYEEMARFKDYTTICTSAPSEFLAGVALRNRARLWERNREIIRRNAALLKTFLDGNADRISCEMPKAGCLAFPKLASGSADVFCERLVAKSGVLLAPGSKFGLGESGYFRIGFGRAGFAAGLGRLEESPLLGAL